MHLLDRLGVVARYRHIIVTVLVLVMVATIVQTYTTVPLYRASARVLIEEDRSPVPGLPAADYYNWQDPEIYKNTQYAILNSRDLARRVVQQLDLEKSPLFREPHGGPTGIRGIISRARARLTGLVSGGRAGSSAVPAAPASAPR